jgi:hypothetical protein
VPITSHEAAQIAAKISPDFDKVSMYYDLAKYPVVNYGKFKQSFSSLNIVNTEISDSLLWKWGHWGKKSIPRHHRDLVTEIDGLWVQFVGSGAGQASNQTFDWWSGQLNRRTTYITVAYITHLVHHAKRLPIIDQHNFRAMNSLLRDVKTTHSGKKKPSTWQDIVELGTFMTEVSKALGNKSFEELDRFLMMYGKHVVER